MGPQGFRSCYSFIEGMKSDLGLWDVMTNEDDPTKRTVGAKPEFRVKAADRGHLKVLLTCAELELKSRGDKASKVPGQGMESPMNQALLLAAAMGGQGRVANTFGAGHFGVISGLDAHLAEF